MAYSQTQTRNLRFAGHPAGHFIGQFHSACNRKTAARYRHKLGIFFGVRASALLSGYWVLGFGCWILCRLRTANSEFEIRGGRESIFSVTQHPRPSTQKAAPGRRTPKRPPAFASSRGRRNETNNIPAVWYFIRACRSRHIPGRRWRSRNRRDRLSTFTAACGMITRFRG